MNGGLKMEKRSTYPPKDLCWQSFLLIEFSRDRSCYTLSFPVPCHRHSMSCAARFGLSCSPQPPQAPGPGCGYRPQGFPILEVLCD